MYEMSSKSFTDEHGELYFDVSLKKENGTVVEKRLSVSQYIDLFMQNSVEKETFVVVPQIPKEVIACRLSNNSESSFDAVVLYPAAHRAFAYYGQHFLLPFPALIAKISVRKGVRTQTSLYALSTDKPTDETPLMRYPFGNVNSRGNCCYGNIEVKDVESVAHATDVLDAFLFGETDNDYYEEQNAQGLKQGELIEMLRNLKKFPAKLLIPLEQNITVGKLKEFKN